MSLNDQLTEDLKQAMKAKDAIRLRTIRSLRAALKEKEIAERRDGEAHLSEEQVLAVVQKQAKQRRDAIAQYEPAGRDDLAAKEQDLFLGEVRLTVAPPVDRLYRSGCGRGRRRRLDPL